MSAYIDASSHLHHEPESGLALTCPHCQVLSHITPLAIPRFTELSASRPRHIGIVYRCDACNAPIFLRFAVKMYGPQRIDLSAQFTEIERPREKFNYNYLPESIEELFREALACYSTGAYNAFASMSRRTVQEAFVQSGEAGRMRVFDLLNDVRTMVDLDADTFIDIKRVVFGTDADPHPSLPLFDEQQAGVLLEVMKDLLYQLYVRKGRLQQAMMVRRFFSDESLRDIAARG
jgi:hypothetical protein